MRRTSAAVVLLLFVVVSPAESDERTTARTSSSDDTLVGAWQGRWVAAERGVPKSAELIVVPGTKPGTVVGQFTLLDGGHAWTARRDGLVVGDTMAFELLGGGEIVLRRAGPARLTGEFTAATGHFPAVNGSMDLVRARDGRAGTTMTQGGVTR